ncbi:hypothetical protein AAVH_33356, partial [Aphelenchoides avenae]
SAHGAVVNALAAAASMRDAPIRHALLLLLVTLAGLIIPPRGFPVEEENRCAFNEMDCNLGMGEPYCVPLVAAHDCIVDCPSFVDELCRLKETLCDTTVKHGNSRCGKCVPAEQADNLCADRKWKNLCHEENTVECPGNDNCVHVDWLGDGEDDCGNGADE